MIFFLFVFSHFSRSLVRSLTLYYPQIYMTHIGLRRHQRTKGKTLAEACENELKGENQKERSEGEDQNG